MEPNAIAPSGQNLYAELDLLLDGGGVDYPSAVLSGDDEDRRREEATAAIDEQILAGLVFP